LDGLFLFVKRSIWKENPFDEEKIKGFHFYDADFSFGVAQKWQNYVCLTVDIYHFSFGNCDRIYYENARIFQKKWKDKLPYSINKQKVSLIYELKSAGLFLYKSYRKGLRDNVKHFIEINGIFYFFLFCVLMPIIILRKIVNIIKQNDR